MLIIFHRQDKKDDAIIGIKSTALKFNEYTKPWLWANGVGVLCGLTAVGVNAELDWPYYGALGVIAAHISRQVCFHSILSCKSVFFFHK